MIISGLLNGIYNLLNSVLSGLDIPGLPEEANSAIFDFFNLLSSGKHLINFIIPIDLTPYFTLYFAIFGFEHLYPVIMWILRKIPMLGIK